MAMENNEMEVPESHKSPNTYIAARGFLRSKSILHFKMPYPVPLSHDCSSPQRSLQPLLVPTSSSSRFSGTAPSTSVSAPAAIFIIIAYVAYTSRLTMVPSLHPWSSLQPAGDSRTWSLGPCSKVTRSSFQLAFRNTPVRPS